MEFDQKRRPSSRAGGGELMNKCPSLGFTTPPLLWKWTGALDHSTDLACKSLRIRIYRCLLARGDSKSELAFTYPENSESNGSSMSSDNKPFIDQRNLGCFNTLR